ncbi:ATPase domain protein, prokaryote domain protein [mine drainage metagenome]|uniref:ATPase domain protein, prokaryote domain protein n=2 Tax=mine drainage metagenome TaxID=410659 RepID=T1BY83_9ZZZZ
MFVGRRAELDEFHRVLTGNKPRLVRLYGRRRVGKTELLTRLLQAHPGLYLNVDEAEYEVQRRTLASQVASQAGHEARFYADWDGFLDDLEMTNTRLVVIDEFQNLIRTGHGLLGRLQARWDSKWKSAGPSLVLSGSSVGMMQRLTQAPRAPLFGRITDNMHLRPLAYHEARDLYPGLPEEERVRRYATFGGTPFYHDLSIDRSLDDALWEALLRPNAPLLNEPEDLLRSEFQDASRPNSILREIGLGAHALHDLESRVGVQHGGLSQHLVFLEHDMDLVLHEEPVLGKKRLGHYVLPDPILSVLLPDDIRAAQCN